MEYEYAVYPHTGNWQQGNVYSEAMALNAPPAVFQVSPNKSSIADLPPAASFFAVEHEGLILSTFKKAEDRDGCIMRLFNPTAKDVTGIIRVPSTVKTAWLTNLDEKRLQRVPIKNGMLKINAGANKMITVEMVR
jgi:alpha-mannosidase